MLTLVTRAVEEVLQRPSRLILRIEIEQCDWDLIGFKPLGQGDDNAGFAHSAFATHGEDDSLCKCRHCSPPSLVRVRGSFSRKTKRPGFDFGAVRFCFESCNAMQVPATSDCGQFRSAAVQIVFVCGASHGPLRMNASVLGATYSPSRSWKRRATSRYVCPLRRSSRIRSRWGSSLERGGLGGKVGKRWQERLEGLYL